MTQTQISQYTRTSRDPEDRARFELVNEITGRVAQNLSWQPPRSDDPDRETDAARFHRAQLAFCQAELKPHKALQPAGAILEMLLIPVRDEHIRRFGFPIINRGALLWIKEQMNGAELLEIGAGNGYLASEMQRVGQRVIATEPHPSGTKGSYDLIQPRPELEQPEQCDGRTALLRYPGHNMLWSWPQMQDYTQEIIESFQGERFIYIGERKDGCTGSQGFHETLEREFEQVGRYKIPTYPKIYDRIYSYRRKVRKMPNAEPEHTAIRDALRARLESGESLLAQDRDSLIQVIAGPAAEIRETPDGLELADCAPLDRIVLQPGTPDQPDPPTAISPGVTLVIFLGVRPHPAQLARSIAKGNMPAHRLVRREPAEVEPEVEVATEPSDKTTEQPIGPAEGEPAPVSAAAEQPSDETDPAIISDPPETTAATEQPAFPIEVDAEPDIRPDTEPLAPPAEVDAEPNNLPDNELAEPPGSIIEIDAESSNKLDAQQPTSPAEVEDEPGNTLDTEPPTSPAEVDAEPDNLPDTELAEPPASTTEVDAETSILPDTGLAEPPKPPAEVDAEINIPETAPLQEPRPAEPVNQPNPIPTTPAEPDRESVDSYISLIEEHRIRVSRWQANLRAVGHHNCGERQGANTEQLQTWLDRLNDRLENPEPIPPAPEKDQPGNAVGTIVPAPRQPCPLCPQPHPEKHHCPECGGLVGHLQIKNPGADATNPRRETAA